MGFEGLGGKGLKVLGIEVRIQGLGCKGLGFRVETFRV